MSSNKIKANVLSLYEIMSHYRTRNDAIRYFEQTLWGDEPVCAKCGCTGRITPQKKVGDYWCGDCRSYFTVFTNTPLERTKIDPRKWIHAAYTLMTSRKGVSSLQLSKEIGVQHRTAWYMLHRLRLACGDQLEALSGVVEADETFIGGKEHNKHTHKRIKGGDKQVVFGMREREGGRVKAMPVESRDGKILRNTIRKHVEKGSTICTDDYRGYRKIIGDGRWPYEYNHEAVSHSAKQYVDGMASTNGMESVWAIIKRGFNGIYHHWSRKHCHQYVNEFTFRLNEGNCDRDTQDRLDALFKAMVGKTITYKELTS